MIDFSNFTNEQISTSLSSMKASRKIAQEAKCYGLVESLQYYIDQMIEVLISRNDDPHTSAADIRYFENQD